MIFAIVAGLLMVVVMTLDYDWFRHRARQIYVGTLGLLSGLLLLGQLSGGTRISFDLGPINVQPAEIAKFSVLLMLAAYLAEERTDEVSYPRFLGGLIIVGLTSVLVLVQPDLGSTSVLVAMAMGMLLVAGAKVRYIVAFTFLSLATVGGRLHRPSGERLPARAGAGAVRRAQPGAAHGDVPGEPGAQRPRHRRASSARAG